jgi:hypothetical protein
MTLMNHHLSISLMQNIATATATGIAIDQKYGSPWSSDVKV